MPSVQGILETALYVRDLKKTAEFYRGLFGFQTLLESDRLIALNVAGKSVLLLFKEGVTTEPYETPGGVIPGHTGAYGGHFAFTVSAHEIPGWIEQLKSKGVALEGSVTWPGGAKSLYFRDPDHCLVELITTGFWKM